MNELNEQAIQLINLCSIIIVLLKFIIVLKYNFIVDCQKGLYENNVLN